MPGPRGLMKSTATQVVSAVVATAVIAALGIERLPTLLPWTSESSSTSVAPQSETYPAPTTIEPSHSSNSTNTTITTAMPRTTVKPGLAKASFSNDLLTAAQRDGHTNWSTIPLSLVALKEGTQHDNVAKISVSTSATPSICKWELDTLYFMKSGLCAVTVTIPQASKSARYEKLEKKYRINVRRPVLPSPGAYSPHERVSAVATARRNFLTYGREVPTELTFGDVLGYWHMRMRISMKQPDPALGAVRCHRVYVRYQYRTKQSYNDFTEDQVGCQELNSTTEAREFCVNFQPNWYKLTGQTKETMGIVDPSGAALQDNYAVVKFSRIGWGLEWGWETYNENEVPANKTLTSTEKAMVESETHRPSVEVQEIAAGKCS